MNEGLRIKMELFMKKKYIEKNREKEFFIYVMVMS